MLGNAPGVHFANQRPCGNARNAHNANVMARYGCVKQSKRLGGWGMGGSATTTNRDPPPHPQCACASRGHTRELRCGPGGCRGPGHSQATPGPPFSYYHRPGSAVPCGVAYGPCVTRQELHTPPGTQRQRHIRTCAREKAAPSSSGGGGWSLAPNGRMLGTKWKVSGNRGGLLQRGPPPPPL